MWQSASSTRTAARSASSAACDAPGRRARARAPSPARACSASAALAGRGDEQLAGQRARPRRGPAGAGRRAASTSASTSPSAELAQPRVDVAAQLDDLALRIAPGEQLRARGAATTSRRAPAGAPTITSRGSSRGGTATISVPSASSPGTSLAECTARSISPADQRRLDRVHPARLVAGRAARRRPTCAARRPRRRRAAPRPSRPARAPGRCRASRCASARAQLRGLRPAGPVVGAARRSSESPNSSRSRCMRAWRSAAGLLDLQRRLVQQPLAPPRGRPPRRARGRAPTAISQRPRVLGQHAGDDVVAVRAQRGDRRHDLERAEPAGEAADLLLDDALGLARLGAPDELVALDDGAQVVDVGDA